MTSQPLAYYLQLVGSKLGLTSEPEHVLVAASTEEEKKQELLAVLAHELRNPLAAIISSAELLKLQKMSTADATATLETIEDRVHAITDILNDMLTPVSPWREIVPIKTSILAHTHLAPTIKSRLHSGRKVPQAKQARTILVVDDNEVAAEALGRLLELRGHTVTLAFDGSSAIRNVRELHPEVIILDIGLPDIDGYEVAHILQQEKHFSSTLIALTGYGQAQDKERARKAGFHAHMVKPVGIAEIEEAFRRLPRASKK
ncbi:MAG: response regulator [Minisyncoccia bacterium]|jgi:CheY-like chemotaxis protein